jgi:hypothetical protein
MKTLYSQGKLCFLLAVIFISQVLGTSFTQAQVPEQVATPEPAVSNKSTGPTILADTNIVGGGVRVENSRQIIAGFTLENRLGIQEGVRFGIEVYTLGEEPELVDVLVSPETVSLEEGQYSYQELSYTPPASLSAGSYNINAVAWSDKGLSLAFRTLGEATFEESNIPHLAEVSNCDMENPSEDGFVDCVIKNLSDEKQSLKLLATYTRGNLFGETLGEPIAYEIALEPKAEIKQAIRLLEMSSTTALTIQTQLLNESGVLIDNNQFTKSASVFKPSILNIYASTTKDGHTLAMSIRGSRGGETVIVSPTTLDEACKEMVVPVAGMRTDILLPLACHGELSIALFDSVKNLLDYDLVTLPEPEPVVTEEVPVTEGGLTLNWTALITIVAALGLLVMLIVFMKQKKVPPVAVMLLFAFVSLIPSGVEAVTFGVSKDYQCVNQTLPSGCNRTTDFYTVNATINAPTSIQAGEVYSVSADINASTADGLRFTGVNMGAAPPCPPGNGAGSGCSANDFSRSLSSFNSVQAGEVEVNIGTRSFTVPANTPAGTYKVGFWSWLTNIPEGSTGYASTLSYESVNFTVTAAPAQCNDGIDNDGDGLSDTNDPGCHSDCNATNSSSYVASDNTENTACTPTVRLTPRQR